MSYFVIKVEIYDRIINKNAFSLVFTEAGEPLKAQKLAAFHIFHLHRNDQETLSSVEDVRLGNNNEIIVDDHTTMRIEILSKTNQQGIHKLGGLGLFGYNKKLLFFKKKFSLINQMKHKFI